MLIHIEDYLQRRRALAATIRSPHGLTGVRPTSPRAGNALVFAHLCAAARALAVASCEPALPSAWELSSVYAEASLI